MGEVILMIYRVLISILFGIGTFIGFGHHPFQRLDFIIFLGKPISMFFGSIICGALWFICDWISDSIKDNKQNKKNREWYDWRQKNKRD